MAQVTSELNRVIFQSMTAADFAGALAWLAINVDNSGGQTVLIDGLEFWVSVTGADYTNLQFVEVIITEDVILNPGLRLDVQLPAGRSDVFNSIAPELSQRLVSRWFTQPLVLRPNKKYAVVGQAFFAAFAGPATYLLGVYGRQERAGKPYPLAWR